MGTSQGLWEAAPGPGDDVAMWAVTQAGSGLTPAARG